MSEFEDSLRDALRSDVAPADERFVQRVEVQIEAHERGRIAGLTLATAAMIALITVMAAGIGIALPELLSSAGQDLPALPGNTFLALGFAAPAAGLLLLAALAYPLARRRK
jgi:hypothetical protein